MTELEFAGLIDHTLLKPQAIPAQIEQLCREAVEFNFAAVCVNPQFTALATSCLRTSDVKVCVVTGFPLGATLTANKVFEAKNACEQGAQEIDMVAWIGGICSGDLIAVESDIRAVADVCHQHKAILKVILETSLLKDSEKEEAGRVAIRAGTDFLKTSTGFGSGGATISDVKMLTQITAGTDVRIKAAGGIHNYKQADKLLAAGAARIGTSRGVLLMNEFKEFREKGIL